MQSVNRSPDKAEVRSFGLVMLLGFGVIGAALWYFALLPPEGGRLPQSGWGWNGSTRQVLAIGLWGLGATLTVVCLLTHACGRVVHIVWMTGAMHVGRVMTAVLLSLLFAILLPFFSLIRLTDPLRLRAKSANSFWEEPTPHEATLERARRQY